MVYFILLYYYNYICFYFDVWHVRVTLLHSVLVEVFVEFWFEEEFVFNYLQKVFSNFYFNWITLNLIESWRQYMESSTVNQQLAFKTRVVQNKHDRVSPQILYPKIDLYKS